MIYFHDYSTYTTQNKFVYITILPNTGMFLPPLACIDIGNLASSCRTYSDVSKENSFAVHFYLNICRVHISLYLMNIRNNH